MTAFSPTPVLMLTPETWRIHSFARRAKHWQNAIIGKSKKSGRARVEAIRRELFDVGHSASRPEEQSAAPDLVPSGSSMLTDAKIAVLCDIGQSIAFSDELQVKMRVAEAIMHEQIGRDEDCTFVAEEIIKMRVVLSGLVRERSALGDNEPILVRSPFIRRRSRAVARSRVAKRRLVPHGFEQRRGHAHP
ncbi:hypothetical protein [Bradyrhizobium genosp. A]|uniref:hypothetical protein n=1 Tax=Bradyrhizobium genosp. A TaxID=83626 RepID=UPI003CF2A7F5